MQGTGQLWLNSKGRSMSKDACKVTQVVPCVPSIAWQAASESSGFPPEHESIFKRRRSDFHAFQSVHCRIQQFVLTFQGMNYIEGCLKRLPIILLVLNTIIFLFSPSPWKGLGSKPGVEYLLLGCEGCLADALHRHDFILRKISNISVDTEP